QLERRGGRQPRVLGVLRRAGRLARRLARLARLGLLQVQVDLLGDDVGALVAPLPAAGQVVQADVAVGRALLPQRDDGAVGDRGVWRDEADGAVLALLTLAAGGRLAALVEAHVAVGLALAALHDEAHVAVAGGLGAGLAGQLAAGAFLGRLQLLVPDGG